MDEPRIAYKAFDELALDDAAGRFQARVAVFDTVDRAGDRIRPGAFAASLKRWADAPGAIPVVWSHAWGNVMQVLGKVLTATEDAAGLVVDGQLDLTHPEAARAYALLKNGTVTAFSFAFKPLRTELVKERGQIVREILEADVLEVGPCIAGMNEAAGLLTVKALSPPSPPPEVVAAPVARPRLEGVARSLHLWTLRAALAAGKDDPQ